MEQPGNITPKPANQSWMPAANGILSIISGTLGFIAVAFLITFGSIFGAEIGKRVLESVGYRLSSLPLTFVLIISIPLLLINALAIVGGVFSLQRRQWGIALAGAICALFPSQVMGILAIVFITMSRKEFE